MTAARFPGCVIADDTPPRWPFGAGREAKTPYAAPGGRSAPKADPFAAYAPADTMLQDGEVEIGEPRANPRIPDNAAVTRFPGKFPGPATAVSELFAASAAAPTAWLRRLGCGAWATARGGGTGTTPG